MGAEVMPPDLPCSTKTITVTVTYSDRNMPKTYSIVYYKADL